MLEVLDRAGLKVVTKGIRWVALFYCLGLRVSQRGIERTRLRHEIPVHEVGVGGGGGGGFDARFCGSAPCAQVLKREPVPRLHFDIKDYIC